MLYYIPYYIILYCIILSTTLYCSRILLLSSGNQQKGLDPEFHEQPGYSLTCSESQPGLRLAVHFLRQVLFLKLKISGANGPFRSLCVEPTARPSQWSLIHFKQLEAKAEDISK